MNWNYFDQIQEKTLEEYYTLTEEELFKKLTDEIKDFSKDEFEDLKKNKRLDYRVSDGKIMYSRNTVSSLANTYIEYGNRARTVEFDRHVWRDEVLDMAEKEERTESVIRIRHVLNIAENIEGPFRVHIPFPLARSIVKEVKFIDASETLVKLPQPEEHMATAYFEGDGREYFVEYEVRNSIDVFKSKDSVRKNIEEGLLSDPSEYLGEKPPGMVFTDFLRSLAMRLAEGKSDKLSQARSIYDYITTKVEYRYVPPYFTIRDIPSYCADNLRGDCGVQALLFITLCRILGIPATFESGIDAKPGSIGPHDWARFYIEEYGWLYADLSYGGDAYRQGQLDLWNFFFGNVDPFRIPFNEDFLEELVPPKRFGREDPYDNQTGEAENSDSGLRDNQLSHKYIEKEIILLK